MKVGMCQATLCERAKIAGGSRAAHLWTAGRVMVAPCEKQVLFVLACCPRQGRCKVLTYLVWVLVLWGCSLAGPFQPARSLRISHPPQLSTCLQQQWRSKLSTSNKSARRWGKNNHSLQRLFGPTYGDVSMSRALACIGLTGTLALVCGNGQHVSKYWDVILCTVNGTLMQQLLLLCLKNGHPSPVIVSDCRDSFNFVFLRVLYVSRALNWRGQQQCNLNDSWVHMLWVLLPSSMAVTAPPNARTVEGPKAAVYPIRSFSSAHVLFLQKASSCKILDHFPALHPSRET